MEGKNFEQLNNSEDANTEMKKLLEADFHYNLERIGDQEKYSFEELSHLYEEKQKKVLVKLSQLESYLDAKEHIQEIDNVRNVFDPRISRGALEASIQWKNMEVEKYRKIIEYFENDLHIPKMEIEELKILVDDFEKTKDSLEKIQGSLQGDNTKTRLN